MYINLKWGPGAVKQFIGEREILKLDPLRLPIYVYNTRTFWRFYPFRYNTRTLWRFYPFIYIILELCGASTHLYIIIELCGASTHLRI